MKNKKVTKEKIKATRSKIKSHLKTRGEKNDFEITESFCYYWWHRLNEAVFDGVLLPPKRVEIRNFRDCFGWCEPYVRNQKNVKLGIRREMKDKKQFLTVLIHEMVHMYQQQQHGTMSHGSSFYRWASKIKWRVGLELSEYID